MSKTGKPFSPTPDFDKSRPLALPDLLAGLMNNASLGTVTPEPEALIPEVMAPEEPMPPATPVNKSMPEFLDSLRTLLDSYEDPNKLLRLDVPAEAVQDFAHGTNELLNYLLHEVVGAAAPVVEPHAPETVLDFADTTNELLNYLLSSVAEPVVASDTAYTPEAMADFQTGTQDLLGQLLMMADQQEPQRAVSDAPGLMPVVEPPVASEPNSRFHHFEAPAEPPLEFGSAALGDLLGELLSTPLPDPAPPPVEPAPVSEEASPVSDEAASGLLSGLLANLAGADVHNLGEVPREYIDESDKEEVARPAGAFEMLLDAIDHELPAPPTVLGIVQAGAAEPTPGDRFIAFEVGTESYALPFSCVLKTDRVPRWTHVPGMAAHLRGVINLRGEIIPLVDLRALFGFGAASADGRMIVIRGSNGKTSAAFVADCLLGLVSLPEAEIMRPKAMGVVRGVASASGRKLGTIDPDRVIAAAHGDAVLPRHTILTKYLEEQSYV